MARARPYEPAKARWFAADPIEPSIDDVNLFQYARNAPLIASDPSGLSFDASNGMADGSCTSKTCCCCAVKLAIPEKRITDIPRGKVPHLPKGQFAGKVFVLTIETQWKLSPVEADCVLDWYEWLAMGDPKQSWINQAGLPFGQRSVIFRPWFNERKKPCPKPETTEIKDYPSLAVGKDVPDDQVGKQEIYFALRLQSAPNCPCDEPSAIVYAYFLIETERFGLTVRPKKDPSPIFKPIPPPLPTPPGDPPNGPWPQK